MRRSLVAGTVLSVLLTGSLLASCGDDDDTSTGSASGSGSASSPAAEAPVSLPGDVNDHGAGDVGDSGTLDLELDDEYFAPTFVDAPAGSTVEVSLENEGDEPHTFTIDGTDVDEQVAPGAKATVEVTLPDSGSLRFYCRFHVGSGMQGAFVVSGDAASAPTTVVSGGGVSGGY
jgi:plastocyanin